MVQMVQVQMIDDRILFDETFIDKIGLFNINTLGSGGQAVKVNTGGTGLEFHQFWWISFVRRKRCFIWFCS